MRAAAWVVLLATVLGALALFLPSLELRLAGAPVSRRTQVSLYKIARDRAVVRRLIAIYHRSDRRKLGDRLIHAASPHVDGALAHKLGKLRDAFDDTRDAMDALDSTSDDDVRAATTLFAIALAVLGGLDLVLVCLVFIPLVGTSGRRGGHPLRIAIAVLIAALSGALYYLCREIAWYANDELGHPAVALTAGAHVLPIAAAIGLVATIVYAVRGRR